MGAFTLAFFFVFTFSLQQSFADDPAFPSFSGDIIISGYIQTKNQKTMFKSWTSDSIKASRTDIVIFGLMLVKRYAFESEGPYGTAVVVMSGGGQERCLYKKGTAEKPVKYEPIISSSKDMTYAGTETVDGVELQKWESRGEEGNPVIYIRQDANGPVPDRIVQADKTVYINIFSSTPIPADIFKYNSKGCIEETKEIASSRPYENLPIFNQVFKSILS